MAKYCPNCGKVLPDGADFCPDCKVAGMEDIAAPFTRMTAETEVWKEEPRKKERPKRTRTQKQTIACIIGAAAAALLAVCLILYIQPLNRTIRALRSGDYDAAREIYWGDGSLSSGTYDDRLRGELLRAAEQVRDAFAAHTLDADEAATDLGKLGTLGGGAEALLGDIYAEYRALAESGEHMARAAGLARSGDYLAAREEYLLVIEADSDYAAARQEAELCLERYAEQVLSDADMAIQSGDYGAAIETMEAGEQNLLSCDVYNSKLDFKLNATYTLYETDLLQRAEEFAGREDYAAAAELLRQGMERFGHETDALRTALDGYAGQAREKEAAEAAAEAERLYAAGDHAGAFALLDGRKEQESGDARADAVIDGALEALEARFAAEVTAEAEDMFAGERENLPGAVKLLSEALRVRRLDAVEEYREELSRYLPVSLAEAEYTEKVGTIFRSSGVFEALDGTEYTEGWIWGEDGAELTFTLGGGYDLLVGTLTVRRDDNASASGYFEILCDGERVYKSETLHHWDKEPAEISVEISGCDRLTLRFFNDYAVRTADNGYCYHGLCGPTITKNMESEGAAEAAETAAAE